MLFWDKLWERAILLLFTLFLALLCVLSFRQYAMMIFDFHLEQTNLIDRSPVITLLVIAFLFMALAIMYKHSHRINTRLVAAVIFVLYLIMGFIWITSNDYPATWDQLAVWEGALNRPEDLQSNIRYYTYNAHQTGMTWVMRVFISVVRSESVMSWRIMNVFVMASIAICLVLLADAIHSGTAVITAVYLMIFLPSIFYTSFVYGTVLSLALVLYSIYCCYRFFDGGKLTWLIAPVLMIPLANLTYSGTYVATIAVCISLLSYSLFTSENEGNNMPRRLAALVAIVFITALTIFGTRYAKKEVFNSFGIYNLPKGKPAVAYAYMGITSEEEVVCGPGSYSYAADDLYSEYGDEASGPAKELLVDAIRAYITGERSLNFFVEKTKYQWLDPTFGSIVMTCYFDWLECSPGFYNFLTGGIPKAYIQFVLRNIVPFVFAFAFIAGVLKLVKGGLGSVGRMVCILFIGGFIFQLIWESKARYCYPYFMLLIPMASCGVGALCNELQVITKRSA